MSAEQCPVHSQENGGGYSWLPSFAQSKQQPATCPFAKDAPAGAECPVSKQKKQLKPIPGPPGLPIVGNIFDMDLVTPLKTIEGFADQYGPIYTLKLGGRENLVLSSHELINEACDEKRFAKQVAGGLEQVRNGVGDGLFTGYTGEENWGVAHRILIPAFGPLSIRDMFDEMVDMANQLALKWARLPTGTAIDASDDFTRLTLDTIALCAMGGRFNSFYTEHQHPFVDAMVNFLIESGNRGRRLPAMNRIPTSASESYFKDIDFMKQVALDLLKERRENPTDKKDLLNAMINGKDPQTGKGLSDQSIVNNMITFLIAGHETTSGTLAFTMHNLLKNPSTYKKIQEEIDTVCGRGPISLEHLPKLKYTAAVLRETLRLSSPIPIINVRPHPFDNHEDPILLNGQYKVGKDQSMILLIKKMHQDPNIYGQDADEFKPERMLDEEFNKLPPNAWKPFGNGVRACIGRPFAWQEMLLVLAVLFQNFDFYMADSSYQLAIKQNLTIKPKDFYMKARLRHGMTPINLQQNLGGGHAAGVDVTQAGLKDGERGDEDDGTKQPMYIFYGSNTGTCEAFANRLAADASTHGFKAKVDSLDGATNNLPKDGPVVIITASFEGQPPDNAAHFCEWIKSCSGEEAKGVKFTVFGCGHHDWATTYQRVPKQVDEMLGKLGGERLCERGEADAAAGDMFSDFGNWVDGTFWPSLGDAAKCKSPAKSGLAVKVLVENRPTVLGQNLKTGVVVENKRLTTEDVPEKRHLEINLPSEYSYKPGDYLAVLPTNQESAVKRAMRRFSLPWDAALKITTEMPTTLPTDTVISAGDLLSSYVELSQPATKRDLNAIADCCDDENLKKDILALANDADRFSREITQPRLSALDFLEKYPKIQVPIGEYLGMLPPMRIRQYSISSSPLSNPESCTLTYSVLNEPSLADSERKHLGVASNYLSSLETGDKVQVSIRNSHGGFSLPLDIASVPLIMVAAGSGLAPFRGFIMERAAQKSAGRELAPAMLFFGCKHPEKDSLYPEEFKKWAEMGAVDVRFAYSQAPEQSEGCKHVQDRLWNDREAAVKLFENSGKVFVCGSKEVGKSVKDMCKKIYKDGAEKMGKNLGEEAVEEWFENLGKERFATDVFA
ncbi:hypothetical protein H072_10584 [Dactylellina haptotyla CBS 200.50]|uniref:Bifunctional cytochrome P450/NADPH--P450 reductase n=1 Tax=Dactylellina haptotyla (strain CBS 200.50) TaxID=1284197 RepID=S8BA48_DACHA|nr:hypothetical protein H072_10584 [Dactylellina haptotyla CBS 200.50]